MDALINSGVFQVLETAISDGAKMFTDFINGDGLGLIEKAVKSAKDTFNELVQAFKDGKLMETIGGYLGDGLKKLGTMMEPHISAALSGLKDMAMAAIFGKKTEQEGPPGGGGNAADMEGENGFTALGDIIKMIAGAGAIGGLTALGTMLAAGGIVYLGFKAFTSVLKMFASGPVAIGAAVFTGMLIGTGAAIMLAGKGISAAGDGVQKVADGVEQMAGLKDTANFTDIAQALGALGPALISLTAGGVLDSITSFFGADSPFDKLVEGINEFKGVDQSALTNVNSSASALSKLSAFDSELDASNLKKYADQLERVGEALEKMND